MTGSETVQPQLQTGGGRPPPLEKTIFIGTFVSCSTSDPTALNIREKTAVGVDEAGLIAFIESDFTISGNEEDDGVHVEVLKKRRGWIGAKTVIMPAKRISFWFPGFIDTHIHASQFPNAGIFGKTTLLDWLNKYTFPLESSLSSIPKAKAVYGKCVARTLANGTTTASYYATLHVDSTNLLASICQAAGQRAFIGRCNMDSHIHPEYYKDSSAAQAVKDTEATIDYCVKIDPEQKLICPIITPRFVPSCTGELLQGLGELQHRTGLPVQTHVSENKNEIKLVKELFPNSDSYTQVYDKYGLLTPRTVLAHACHLSPDEIKLVKERDAKVSHCPVSNSYLGSGICPVREYMDAGITIGLGTDVSGGWSPSLLMVAREAGGVSRLRTASLDPEPSDEVKDRMKLSPEETLYLATVGGAKCMGLEKKVGVFEVGMEWDAQFVDLGPIMEEVEGFAGGYGAVEIWKGMGWEEIMAKWVFCGDERNTRAVWVAGRLVSGNM